MNGTTGNKRTGCRMAGVIGLGAALLLTGCATAPIGGWPGGKPQPGAPGELLGTVRLGEGLLTGKIELAPDRAVRVQITTEPPTPSRRYESALLTIGKFSPVLGSGFARRKNIFYRKNIAFEGWDIFEIEGDRYQVSWKWEFLHPATPVASVYTIAIREWKPLPQR